MGGLLSGHNCGPPGRGGRGGIGEKIASPQSVALVFVVVVVACVGVGVGVGIGEACYDRRCIFLPFFSCHWDYRGSSTEKLPKHCIVNLSFVFNMLRTTPTISPSLCVLRLVKKQFVGEMSSS